MWPETKVKSEMEVAAMSYVWKPIEDLPDSWEQLASPGLAGLAAVWAERAEKLRESEEQRRFNERLSREWAIETGIIERVYTIDRGTTLMLIERGIEASLIPHGTTDKPAETVVSIVRDHQEALEWVFDFVAQRKDLTTSYIKELHQVLTRHQVTVSGVTQVGVPIEVELVRGDWKKLPNSPTKPDGSVHEYCPPLQVPGEMDTLVAMHNEHCNKDVPPEVESAWLHHRFTQIHPFMDGNGRVARALASLVLLRARWFPLVIHRDIGDRYLDCLEAADAGDLRPLVSLFAEIQTRAFNSALSVLEGVLPRAEPEPVQELIQDAVSRLREKRDTRLQEQQSVFQVSKEMEAAAAERMEQVAHSLSAQLGSVDPSYYSVCDSSTPDTDFWFKMQITTAAKSLGYYADTRSYRAWARLRIREERYAHLVLSFHSLGVEFLGVMAVSAFLEYRDRDEDGEIKIEEPRTICPSVFQFSYKESSDYVVDRFRVWLDQVLAIGLEEWRRQL